MNCYDYDNQPDPGDMPMHEPDLDPADTFDAEVNDFMASHFKLIHVTPKQKRTAEPEPNDHGEPDWSTYQ
jgi:hypothetical protein